MKKGLHLNDSAEILLNQNAIIEHKLYKRWLEYPYKYKKVTYKNLFNNILNL